MEPSVIIYIWLRPVAVFSFGIYQCCIREEFVSLNFFYFISLFWLLSSYHSLAVNSLISRAAPSGRGHRLGSRAQWEFYRLWRVLLKGLWGPRPPLFSLGHEVSHLSWHTLPTLTVQCAHQWPKAMCRSNLRLTSLYKLTMSGIPLQYWRQLRVCLRTPRRWTVGSILVWGTCEWSCYKFLHITFVRTCILFLLSKYLEAESINGGMCGYLTLEETAQRVP